MDFLLIAVAFLGLTWLMGLLLPSIIQIPTGMQDGLVGLGELIANVGYFVPVASIMTAVGFVILIYNMRIAIQIFRWVMKLLPFIGN